MKGQNFSSQVLSRHTFRILRKKGSDLFDHRGTLKFSKALYGTKGGTYTDWSIVVLGVGSIFTGCLGNELALLA